MTTTYGPFETAQEARAAAHTIIQPADGLSILDQEQNRALLEQACEAADVEPGAYGLRVLGWMAGDEDSLCGAIADIITRAHEAGKRGGRA